MQPFCLYAHNDKYETSHNLSNNRKLFEKSLQCVTVTVAAANYTSTFIYDISPTLPQKKTTQRNIETVQFSK